MRCLNVLHMCCTIVYTSAMCCSGQWARVTRVRCVRRLSRCPTCRGMTSVVWRVSSESCRSLCSIQSNTQTSSSSLAWRHRRVSCSMAHRAAVRRCLQRPLPTSARQTSSQSRGQSSLPCGSESPRPMSVTSLTRYVPCRGLTGHS